MDYINLESQDFSFLGKGSHLEGSFQLKGTTRLASFIEGSINMKDNADLFIETSGKIRGEIVCHNLEVYGEIEGVVRATGKVSLYPPARFSGEISAENLVIYPGAQVNMDGKTTKH